VAQFWRSLPNCAIFDRKNGAVPDDLRLRRQVRMAEMALSAVRKNPQEPAQTRGSRQKKANPEGLVFPLLVELAGFEPASASLLRADLHV